MKQNRTLVIIGALIAILPFLGFPLLFKNILFLILGVSVVYISFKLKNSKIKPENDISAYKNGFVHEDSNMNSHLDFAENLESESDTQEILDDQENQQH